MHILDFEIQSETNRTKILIMYNLEVLSIFILWDTIIRWTLDIQCISKQYEPLHIFLLMWRPISVWKPSGSSLKSRKLNIKVIDLYCTCLYCRREKIVNPIYKREKNKNLHFIHLLHFYQINFQKSGIKEFLRNLCWLLTLYLKFRLLKDRIIQIKTI